MYFTMTMLLRMSMYSSTDYYCKLDRDKTGASGPRGGCARDFVDFRKNNLCIAHARCGRAGLTVYPPRIQIRDVAAPLARRDHRKSEFGLRHAIKLNQLYCVTKSEFGYSMIPPSYMSGNVPIFVPLNFTVQLQYCSGLLQHVRMYSTQDQQRCPPAVNFPNSYLAGQLPSQLSIIFLKSCILATSRATSLLGQLSCIFWKS